VARILYNITKYSEFYIYMSTMKRTSYSRSVSVMSDRSWINDNAFENQEKDPSLALPPVLANMNNDDEWAAKRPQVRRAFLLEFGRNAVALIINMFPEVTNLAMMSAFGDDLQVAAVGLGNSAQTSICQALGYGLNSALDLFASTSVTDKKQAGMLYLGRASIATTLCYLLISPIFWYAAEIFIALGQDPTVAAYASDYVRAALIGMWFQLQANGLNRFLVNQGKADFCARAKMATCPLHYVWCYFFVGYLGYGNAGLGFANVITWVLQYIVYLSYFIYNHDTYGLTLGRYLYNFVSPDTWRGMGEYFGAAIPAAIMMASMWIWWEVLVLLVGSMSDHRLLTAHVTVYMLVSTSLQLNFALNGTMSGYVGGSIGRQNAPCARRCYVMTRNIGLIICLISAGLLGLGAPLIATRFVHDEATVEITKNTLRIGAWVVFFTGASSYFQSLLRVCRRAHIVAVVALVQNFGLGLCFVMLLSFYYHYGVYGVWSACGVAATVGYFLLWFAFTGVNFDEEVEKARLRLQEVENKKMPLLAK